MGRICDTPFLPLGLSLACAIPSPAPAEPAAPPAARDVTPVSGEWDSGNRAYPFVMREGADGPYALYYSGAARAYMNDSTWSPWETGRATSSDGVSWSPGDTRKPVLPARRFLEGDVLNPEDLSGVFDSVYAVGACVLKDDAVYKMWYTGWNGDGEHVGGGVENKIHFRIGYATSPDGIRWTKHGGTAGAGSVLGTGPAGAQDAKGVSHPRVLKEGGAYRMWYEGFDSRVWRIFLATSPDGIAWTRRGRVLGPGGSGAPDELGARRPVVFSRNGQYELWYQGWSRSAPATRVLRAVSADGQSWKKIPDEVVLHPPDPLDGAEQIYVGSVWVLPDNACRVYFAKENTATRKVTAGEVSSRQYRLHTEVVNP